MSTQKGAKPAWYGLAAVALGTGIFFLATNKGRLFKKSTAGLKALLGGAAAPVRDAAAPTPPKPATGGSFAKPGDAPGPQ